MGIIKVYKELLEDLDLTVDDNGYIWMIDSKFPLTVDKLQVVLPTTNNIKNSIAVEDGEIKQVFELFNPFSESAVTGENKSVVALKTYLERKVNTLFSGIVSALLLIASNEKKYPVDDMDFIGFIEMLNKEGAHVDTKSYKNWTKLHKKVIFGPSNGLFTFLYLKRGGKVDGERYNRLASITFPVYKKLVKEEVDEYKIRKADIKTYKVVHEYVFDMSQEELLKGVLLGSKSTTSPATLVLLAAYDWYIKRLNKVIDMLIDLGFDELTEDLKELKAPKLSHRLSTYEKYAKEYNSEIKAIPTDITSISKTIEVDDDDIAKEEEVTLTNEGLGVLMSVIDDQTTSKLKTKTVDSKPRVTRVDTIEESSNKPLTREEIRLRELEEELKRLKGGGSKTLREEPTTQRVNYEDNSNLSPLERLLLSQDEDTSETAPKRVVCEEPIYREPPRPLYGPDPRNTYSRPLYGPDPRRESFYGNGNSGGGWANQALNNRRVMY